MTDMNKRGTKNCIFKGLYSAIKVLLYNGHTLQGLHTMRGLFLPPILSITAPSTNPTQVSITIILLPARTFPQLNIWASVSYRKWLF